MMELYDVDSCNCVVYSALFNEVMFGTPYHESGACAGTCPGLARAGIGPTQVGVPQNMVSEHQASCRGR